VLNIQLATEPIWDENVMRKLKWKSEFAIRFFEEIPGVIMEREGFEGKNVVRRAEEHPMVSETHLEWAKRVEFVY
jgi:hypothetical protein